MTPELWWIVGVYLAAATAFIIANALPHAQERAVLRLASSLGLTLSAELGEAVRQRMLRERRSYLLGGMAGMVGSALAVGLGGQSSPAHLMLWFLFGGTFTGSAIGMAVGALFSARRQENDRHRLARATAVGLNDYLAPIDLGTVRLPASLAAAAIPLSLLGGELGWLDVVSEQMLISGGLLAAMAVASLVVFEVAARRTVAKGSQVGSLEELVWDDASRYRLARALSLAPFALGVYSLGLTLSALGIMSAGADGTNNISVGVFGTLLICSVIALWVARLAKSERHFLRRLWPELAAAAVQPRPMDATP